MNGPTAFETATYTEINDARWDFFAPRIAELKKKFALNRALDVGAGAGYFAERLAQAGFVTTAVDGRDENIAVISARHPTIAVGRVDIQQPGALSDYGDHDFLFCAGLLYHLDNPVAGIRNVAEHPARILFVETQLMPGEGPMLRLVEEGATETQGLSYLALIPTRDTLVRLLELSGRSHVYEISGAPVHAQFSEQPRLHQLRRNFVAAREPIDLPWLQRLEVRRFGKGFHTKKLSLWARLVLRLTGR